MNYSFLPSSLAALNSTLHLPHAYIIPSQINFPFLLLFFINVHPPFLDSLSSFSFREMGQTSPHHRWALRFAYSRTEALNSSSIYSSYINLHRELPSMQSVRLSQPPLSRTGTHHHRTLRVSSGTTSEGSSVKP